MKNLTIELNNFGKTPRTQVRLGNFTVLAGGNNSGKNFVSKALYSLFSAPRFNTPVETILMPRLRVLAEALSFVPQHVNGWEAAREILVELEEIALHRAHDPQFSCGAPDLAAINELLANLETNCKDLFPTLKPTAAGGEFLQELFSLQEWSAARWAREALGAQIKENLIGNFQVPTLKKLCSAPGQMEFAINIPEIGAFTLENETIKCNLSTGSEQLNRLAYSIYLGAPLLWGLAVPLAKGDKSDFLRSAARVPQVPKYFHDTLSALEETGLGEPLAPALEKRLEAQIAGKLKFENGEFHYCEHTKNTFPLAQAAAGIVNPGMLRLLLEKNLLVPGGCLFIEDPETNQHPAGQVEMAATLFALAAKGVNIIMSTHSAEILKWLEIKIKEDPAAESKIALNYFSGGRVAPVAQRSLTAQLDEIQENLAGPFYQLFYRGLGANDNSAKHDSGNSRE